MNFVTWFQNNISSQPKIFFFQKAINIYKNCFNKYKKNILKNI